MRHYFLLTNPSTDGKIQFIFYWNWMMTVFSLHISARLHLTIVGIWSNSIQSVQYVICVMIVRGLWNIGLAIRYTIWIVRIYVHHGAPFCVLTVKRHCLPLTRLLQLSIIRLLQYDWLSGYWRVLNTVTCAMETWFLNIYSFFMATNEWMHPKYVCRICKYLFCIHAKFFKHISPS